MMNVIFVALRIVIAYMCVNIIAMVSAVGFWITKHPKDELSIKFNEVIPELKLLELFKLMLYFSFTSIPFFIKSTIKYIIKYSKGEE